MDIDECQDPNTCLNGGVCYNLEGSFNCTCFSGFTGPRCETAPTCSSLPDPYIIDSNETLRFLDLLECVTLLGALHITPVPGTVLDAALAARVLGRLAVLEKYLWVSGAHGLSLDFLSGLTAVASTAEGGAAGSLYKDKYSLLIEKSQGMILSPEAGLSLQQLYASAGATGHVILDGANGGFCTTDDGILSADAGLWWAFTGERLTLNFDPTLCPNATCRLLSDGLGGCSNLCEGNTCDKICAAPGPLKTAAEIESFFSQTDSASRPCDYLDGDLILRNVAPEAFPLLASGFGNLKLITGGLVEENYDMLTLEFLSSLERVRSIFLTNNYVLIDARLPSLQTGADVILGFNPYLCNTATPYGTEPCSVVVVVGAQAKVTLTDEEAVAFFQTSAVAGILVQVAEDAMAREAGSSILAHIITASADVTPLGHLQVGITYGISAELKHADAIETALIAGLEKYFLEELLKHFPAQVAGISVDGEPLARRLDEERTTGTSTLRLRVAGVSATGITLAWDRVVAEGEQALPLDLLLRYRPAASGGQLTQLESLLLRETRADLVVPFSAEREK